jgi:RNA polymerase sigma-70 factor (ECF subfamily)
VFVSAGSEALDGMKARESAFDFDAVFRAQYGRIARVIARVVRDPARAEELAVEVFVKLWRSPAAQIENADAWLYRVAVRKALDELRRRTRRARYESLVGFSRRNPTPEELRSACEQQEKIRLVLAVIDARQSELLLLRTQGLSYEELAATLNLKAVSVGTLLARAQQAFRKEYVTRYGPQYDKE